MRAVCEAIRRATVPFCTARVMPNPITTEDTAIGNIGSVLSSVESFFDAMRKKTA